MMVPDSSEMDVWSPHQDVLLFELRRSAGIVGSLHYDVVV